MSEDGEKVSKTGESKLLYWQITNFMTLSNATVGFDDKNIVGLFGYNSSGKSAALRALEVNMYNRFPQSQVAFIQSGKDYFRVTTVWSDGVVIVKDKYLNGQGLYEMWKGDKCIYSSKQNGVLTKIVDVPQIIQDYLNLVKFEDSYLNSRSCFEKQFLVQTTGSENYTAVNTVLRSEELTLAGSFINTDRNKLASDLSVKETELSVLRVKYKEGLEVTPQLIDALKERDKLIDILSDKSSSVGTIDSICKDLAQIPDIPVLNGIDLSNIELLMQVYTIFNSLSKLEDIPEVSSIDTSQLDAICNILTCIESLRGIPEIPNLNFISDEQLTDLMTVQSSIGAQSENEEEIEEIKGTLMACTDELAKYKEKLNEFGVKTVKCKNCGALVEVGGEHND